MRIFSKSIRLKFPVKLQVQPIFIAILFFFIFSANFSLAQPACNSLFSKPIISTYSDFLRKSKVNPIKDFTVPKLDNYFLLPRERTKLVTMYTSYLYKNLNSELVKKETLRDTEFIQIKDELNEALFNFESYEGVTYSGAALTPEVFRDLKLEKGSIIQFDYFFSTSKSIAVAEGFLASSFKRHPERIQVLYTVEGKSGKEIKDVSHFRSEKEVLFLAGSKFKIINIEKIKPKNSKEIGPKEKFLNFIGYNKIYHVTLKEIKPLKQKKLLTTEVVLPNIEYLLIKAQRLYDPTDWSKALKERPEDPWNYYGEETFKQWILAEKFLSSQPIEKDLSLELLLATHNIAMKNHLYSGLQKRLVKENFRNNIYSESVAVDLLTKIDQGNFVFDLNQNGLRSQTGDHYTHSGDNITNDGQRYYNRSELELLLSNPFFAIDKKDIKKIEDDKYLAEAHYIYPEYIEPTLDLILKKTNKLLYQAKSEEEYIWVVTKFQHAMLSLHPFSDGNGRVIRLIGDWLLKKRNLPVPLYPITTELQMTSIEYYNETIKSMNEYIKTLKNI